MAAKAVLQRLGSLRPQLIVANGAAALLVFDVLGVEKSRRPLFGGKHDLFERLLILGRYHSQSNQRDGGEKCNYVSHKNPLMNEVRISCFWDANPHAFSRLFQGDCYLTICEKDYNRF
jgi:hypothetical protein